MAYRDDYALDFLKHIKSEDLNDLVYCLTRGKDGELRLTEELTNSEEYKLYTPNHSMYWKLIAAEVQCFGANSIATIFRGGKGVLYNEILLNVCDKLKVNYNKNAKIEHIENNLLLKILDKALGEMSQDDLDKLGKDFNVNSSEYTPEILLAFFQTAFNMGGFMSYQITVIVANAVSKALLGKGLTLAGNATLVQAMSIFTGPIGWVLTGSWALIDIAGPAFRVTMPAVIQIALLRKKHLYDKSPKTNNKTTIQCSSCMTKMRIPYDRGDLKVVCPNCGTEGMWRENSPSNSPELLRKIIEAKNN